MMLTRRRSVAPAPRAGFTRVPASVAKRIALDVASTQRGQSAKVIASTLRQYLNAADVTPSQLQFDRLVAAIANGTIR